MTVIATGADGTAAVAAELARGAAVGLPMPTPLPYAVVAEAASAVNRAKGRPDDQPVGAAVAGIEVVAAFLDLDRDSVDLAVHLSARCLCNVLLPVTEAVPRWAAGAVSRGMIAVTLAWLPDLRSLLVPRGHLFLSSANTTGGTVALTAADADVAFAGRVPVLDGDALRDPTVPSGSASILRVTRGRRVALVRDGIQGARGGDDGAQALAALVDGWQAG